MPFAGFKDHAACVKANSDKDDPDAYCAELERKAKEDAALVEVEDLNTYTVVLYGGEDPELIEIKAAKYDTQDKDDWIVFYGADNQPVAEFPRWNIQGLYVNV